MKSINFPALFLAILVIVLLGLVGVAIAFRSIGFILLFLLLGFGTFIFGIKLKRRKKVI